MTTQVVLLRAINVGGRGRVSMSGLRTTLTSLGYPQVRTLLQSGNVVLHAPVGGAALEAKLERELADRLGLQADAIVRSAAEWADVVAGNPFGEVAERDPSHLLALATKRPPPDAAVDALRAAIARVGGHEAVAACGTAIYVTYPDGIGRSKVTTPVVERALGTAVTGRNWNTVVKLARMAAD